MPDYTTLQAQVELFKAKVDSLSATTLDANELVLLASAIKALGEGMGVNDIINAANFEIGRLEDAADDEIDRINNTSNGALIGAHEASIDVLEAWRPNVDNYIATAQTNLNDVISDISALQSQTANLPYDYIITSDVTLQADHRRQYFILPILPDGMIINLPVAPAIGDFVQITDISGILDTNPTAVKINPATKLIMGEAGEMNFDVDYASIRLTYSDEPNGWRIT